MTLRGNDNQDLLDSNTAPATTTAEKLKEAVNADVLPSGPLTIEHYGFSEANTIEEKTNLLDLYQGLLIHLPNPPSTTTVQDWQKRM